MTRIGIIQASSQAEKNELIYNTVKKYAPAGAEVINFGCTLEEQEQFSYIDISVLVGLLLASGAVDFVVTGCSSGQGMMLACNSMPGVICGYAPTPKDAYLFARSIRVMQSHFHWGKTIPGQVLRILKRQ